MYSIANAAFGWEDTGIESVVSPFYQLFDGLQQVVFLYEFTVHDHNQPGDPVNPNLVFKAQWTNGPKEWRGKVGDKGYYPSIIQQPGTFTQELFNTTPFAENASTGLSVSRFGGVNFELEFDSSYDFVDWCFQGFPFVLKVGEVENGLSEFQELFRGEIKDLSWDETSVRISFQDPEQALKEDVQQNVYTGAGKEEGTEDMEDRKKPLCFGFCEGVTGVRIDPVNLVSQVHDGAVKSIKNLRQGALIRSSKSPLFDVSDVGAPVTDLWDWVPDTGDDDIGGPDDGTFITDLAKGLYREASFSDIPITVEVEGDADPDLGGYLDRVAPLVERILLQRAGYDPEQVDGVPQLDSQVPYKTGIYSDNPTGDVDSLLAFLISPLLVFRTFVGIGDVVLARIGNSGIKYRIREEDVISIQRRPSIKPFKSLTMGWRKNFTTLRDDDIVGAAPEADASFAREEFRLHKEVAPESPHSRRARDFTINTLLHRHVDAVEEAKRQIDIANNNVHFYQVQFKIRGFGFDLADRVSLTYPKFKLDNGSSMYAIRIERNLLDSEANVTLWGGSLP